MELDVNFGARKETKTAFDLIEGGDRSREEVTLKQDLRDSTESLLNAIHETNDPPHLFVRDRDLIRIVRPRGQARAERLSHDSLRAHLVKLFKFKKYEQRDGNYEEVPIGKPPRPVLANVLNQPNWDFPSLESIANGPIYGPSWELRTQNGYHEDAKVYVDTGDLDVLPPTDPDTQQVDAARSLLLNELLVDFPFGDESASATHAVALGLLPFIRPAIDGPTPLHLITAPVHGSGKTLLLKVLSYIATGSVASMNAEPEDDAEWRKVISTKLQNSPTFIVFDNVEGLDSGPLANALTSRHWSDRELGGNRQIDVRNDACWVGTANNPKLSGELSRRCVLTRINPQVESPWKRDGEDFTHYPLDRWVEQNRKRLVKAFLVLVEHWKSQGCPEYTDATLGSFGEWTRTVGGILQANGFDGFLSNEERLQSKAAQEQGEWKAFVGMWRDEFGRSPVYSKQLRRLCTENSILLSVIGTKSQMSQSVRLSNALKKQEGRIFDGYKITIASDSNRGTKQYQLQKIQ
jgi:hypothetical protein